MTRSLTDGCDATTLAAPRRCAYCGHRCHGRTCRWHADLARLERRQYDPPTMRDELRAVVKRP